MTVTTGVDITEEEAKLYDRQIRLWGLDAQKRLRASKVLVYGMNGLGAEVVKNIVLAGIKSLTILDPETVDRDNSAANFFVPKDKVGEKRATASLSRAQNLNPSVEMAADTGDLADKHEQYFEQFDVVCLIGAPLKQILRVNEICRALDKKFFCGDTFGFYGFSFSDLVHHTYAEEVQMKKIDGGNDGQPPTKVARLDDESKVMKKTRSFTPFKETLDLDWSVEKMKCRLKRLDSTFFVIQALLRFVEENGKRPSVENMEEDNAKLLDLLHKVLEKGNVPKDKVAPEFVGDAYGEVSPVCAIVGGVLGQEIIKACSHKDPPFKNMFLYNGITSAGNVDCFSK